MKIATFNGAKLMNIADRVGKIEAGYEADLVLLSENPLDDITNTRKIELILLDGKIWKDCEAGSNAAFSQ